MSAPNGSRPGISDSDPLSVDLHPALSPHEAKVESDRCYFCFAAPCTTACPTGIDIPLFIRQIHTGNVNGAAKTIFDENIFGGMCARVCPTETLCEEACVRNLAEEQPVRIGLLQRHASDTMMASATQPYQRAQSTGKHIAVVGAGPAGIACAHRLALYGHKITVFDAQSKAGGLNEYGIASYKVVDNFAQRELDYILSIGGIDIQNGKVLGKDLDLAELLDSHDAVFLGIGLAGVNALGIDGEQATGVEDAVEFIRSVRQSEHRQGLDVGQRVVVIGGGMTAIDAAVQTRMLGSEEVTLVYRRGVEHMNASKFEQELAKIKGVTIRNWLQPRRFLSDGNGQLTAVELQSTTLVDGQLAATADTLTLPVDRVLKAIGQSFDSSPVAALGLQTNGARLAVNQQRRTSHEKIWAGGDCIAGGDDLTVSAVQDGKLAAESIHAVLTR